MATTPSIIPGQAFAWPQGKRAAVSVTFDDARVSQIDCGVPILDRVGVRATFYVTVSAMDKRLEAWKAAVARGHEVGNHTMKHPCTGNFGWAGATALEDLTVEQMEADILDANRQIEARLNIKPQTFAYPCGQTFVGRGTQTQSYVPLIAKHFLGGRGYRNEYMNDPGYCDLAQISGLDFDGIAFDQAKASIDQALTKGRWVTFVGHDVGQAGRQTVLMETLEQVSRYCLDPANGIWIDTVAAIARHVQAARDA